MPKAMKITPNGIEEIDNIYNDPDYKNRRVTKSWDPWALNLPMHWEHKKFKLCVLIPGFFDGQPFNPTATDIYQKLKCQYQAVPDLIYGTMFITNEDEDEIIDFVKDDLDYILSKISGELKYNKPSEFTKRWHAYLASLSGPG